LFVVTELYLNSLNPHLLDAFAVAALVQRSASSLIMDQLENVGAKDILLFTLNNSRM
jgi:ATP phosphoribosyltransferase